MFNEHFMNIVHALNLTSTSKFEFCGVTVIYLDVQRRKSYYKIYIILKAYLLLHYLLLKFMN